MVDSERGNKGWREAAVGPGGHAAGAPRAERPGGDRLAFDEVVGQQDLKEALLAVATDDDLDGLLVSGEKGTAKSTLARGLADLLPEQPVVADCPYGCDPADPTLQCAACRSRDDPPTETRPVPLVTVPLGATRDRLVGSLSVADALDGDPTFQPGLLARAHRGFLYVDEVNLLDDHLVDVLLDAAASGVNRVERDGVAVAHPASFTLIGTMNPEEGDLRPQLRDRFAIRTTVSGCEDLDRRVEIVDRALGRDRSEEGDTDATTAGEDRPSESAERLRRARVLLDDVELPDEYARRIAAACRDAGVDGHRGDVATARTARTLAALAGRTTVIEADLRRAAELALPHRLRSRPFEDPPDASDVLDEHFDGGGDGGRDDRGDVDGGGGEDDRDDSTNSSARSDGDDADGSDVRDDSSDGSASDRDRDEQSDDGGPGRSTSGRRDSVGQDAPDHSTDDCDADQRDPSASRTDDRETRTGVELACDTGDGGRTGTDRELDDAERGSDDADATADSSDSSEAADPTPIVPGQRRADLGAGSTPAAETPDVPIDDEGSTGRRTGGEASTSADGQRVRTRRASGDDRVDPAASVRAAAARGADAVVERDLRASVRQSHGSALVVFAVDASASMRPAMREAKATVLELLRDAYQQRDEVAFVAFAGDDAEVLLPPTDSVQHAARHLKSIPAGDRTPLADGLTTAADVIERADPAASVAVVVTDGRANVADGSPIVATRAAADRLGSVASDVLLVDAGEGGRSSLTDVVERATGASVLTLDALTASRVDATVGSRTGDGASQ